MLTPNTPLTDLSNPVSGEAVVYLGNPASAPLNAAIAGSSGVEAAEPPWIDLSTEVGEPRAITASSGVQPFEAGAVVHPGVGIGEGDTFRRVGSGVAQRKTIVGVDFNQDGLDDLCSIGFFNTGGAPTVINIMFGAPHLLTAGAEATNTEATLGDWNEPVPSFTPGVGTAIMLPNNGPGEQIVAIGSGDFNGDGNPDLALLSNRAVANTPSRAYIVLLSGAPDPAVGASLRIYTTRGTQNAATGEGLYGDVAVGDFTADGIDDVVFSAPGEDASGAGNDQGAVYVIYGRSSVLPNNNLPPSGSLLSAAAGADGVTLQGTLGADEFFGASLGVGDFDGGGPDLWVATAAAGTGSGGLFFFPGTPGALSAQPTIQYTYDGPSDMLGANLPGDIVCGRFTQHGSGFDDVIMGLPGENAVRIIPPSINTSGPITRNGIGEVINTRTVSIGVLGHALALGDVSGDGALDLIVGNYGIGDVYVMYGPINPNGQPRRFSDTDNDFDLGLLSDQDTGQGVGFADFNGDGMPDLWFADPAADMHCVSGIGLP